jgi:hypothetical protein
MSWLVALLAGFQVTIIGRIWVTPEDQEIQTLPAKTATEAFAVGIRLRRPYRRSENAHAEPRDRLVEFLGKDAVPVVEHESVRMVGGQSFPELL